MPSRTITYRTEGPPSYGRKNRQNFYRLQRMGSRGMKAQQQMGKGARGIRWFKLRRVYNFTGGTAPVVGSSLYDPSAAGDWASIVNLFDTYKVYASKIQWIPACPNDEVATRLWAPLYVLCDYDASSPPSLTADQCLQYENCKVKNAYMPWSYYCKVPKIASANNTGTILDDGYIDSSDIPANQGQIVVYSFLLTASPQYGQIVQTYYIGCKDRR